MGAGYPGKHGPSPWQAVVRRSAILVMSLCVCACTPATVKVWPSYDDGAMANEGSVIVRQGDSLYGIASRHGVSVIDLAQANGIFAPFTLHPGDRLRLPGRTKTAAPAVPAASSVRVERLPGAPGVTSMASASHGDAVVVQEGDSLYGIARRHGVSAVDLARANGAVEPFVIHPGDRLRVPATAANATTTSARRDSAPKRAVSSGASNAEQSKALKALASETPTPPAPAVADTDRSTWLWPSSGVLVNAPARRDAAAYALDIAGRPGSPVRSTAAGKVLYSGEGSPGYEQLVVIEHAGGWVSSYSHNRKRLVGEGQIVAAGAVIAEMGRTGADRDMVHFELRHAGQLVDPRTVLPPR